MKIRFDHSSQLTAELESYFNYKGDANSEFEKKTCGRWSCEEHKKFIEGLMKFGKNWKKVEEHIGTRSGAQIRSHAQKFFKRLEREYKKKAAANAKAEELPENRIRSDSFATQFTAECMSDEEEKETSPNLIPSKVQLDQTSELLCSKLTTLTESKLESLQKSI